MKDKFPEYYSPNNDDIKRMWEECVFVLDTNVLLDLYRYTDNTKNDLFTLLDAISCRLWIPYHVGKEFHKRRVDVIYKQENIYDDAKKVLQSTTEHFKAQAKKALNFRVHPHIDKIKFIDKITKIISSQESWIDKEKEKYDVNVYDDEILDKVTELFNGKVGDNYTEEELLAITKEGEKRYKNKTPPGYKDADKNTDNIYGDLIIWKQILDYAKENKKSIIFVTSDDKEDWWRFSAGKKIGPRTELIKEMTDFSGKWFYIYNPDKFIKYANEYLNLSVEDDTITEVKDIRENSSYGLLKDYFSYYPTSTELLGNLDTSSLELAKAQLNSILDTSSYNALQQGLLSGIDTSSVDTINAQLNTYNALQQGLLNGIDTSSVDALNTYKALQQGFLRGIETSALGSTQYGNKVGEDDEEQGNDKKSDE